MTRRGGEAGVNEVAERLREAMGWANDTPEDMGALLDEAIAEERRATVEQIRAAVRAHMVEHRGLMSSYADFQAILDEEAAK